MSRIYRFRENSLVGFSCHVGKNIYIIKLSGSRCNVATLVFRHLERIELDGWRRDFIEETTLVVARGRSRDGANRVYSAQRNGVRMKFAFSFFSLRSIHFANSDVFSPRIGRDSRVGALPSRNSSVTRRLFGTRGSGPEARTVGERHRPWDVEKERCQGRKGGGIAYHLSPCA